MLSDSLLITAFSLSAYGVLAVPPGFASRPVSLAALRSAVTDCKLLRAATTKSSKAECLASLSFSGVFLEGNCKTVGNEN